MSYEDPQEAIDAGAQALRPSHGYPWYDAAKDGLQRVEVRTPEKPSFSHVGSEANSLIYFAALVVLAVALAGVLFLLLRAMGLRKPAPPHEESPAIGEAQRIEALPYPLPGRASARGNLSLLDQARHFYQAGNYAAAMLYLFSHQLVQLDRRQIIRLAKGKTNRQYLREVGQAAVLRQLVGQTLVAFEDVFFGHHDIDRQRFEACWTRLPEFDSLLARGTPSA